MRSPAAAAGGPASRTALDDSCAPGTANRATTAFLFEKRFISALPMCLGVAGGAVAVMCVEIGSEAAGKLSRLQMIACMVGSAALFLLFELQIHQWKGSAVNVVVSD